METKLPQTEAERDALFQALFAPLTPADKKQMTLLETVNQYRRQIVAKRKEGYSVQQIVDCLKQPPLNLTVSKATVHAVIGGPAAKRRAQVKKMEAERTARLEAGGGGGARVAG